MSGTAVDRHHIMRLWHEKADLCARSARRTHRQLGRRSPALHVALNMLQQKKKRHEAPRRAARAVRLTRLPEDRVATRASCPSLRTSPSLEPLLVHPMDSGCKPPVQNPPKVTAVPHCSEHPAKEGSTSLACCFARFFAALFLVFAGNGTEVVHIEKQAIARAWHC